MSDVEEDYSDAESAISELNGEAEYEEFDEDPDEFEGDEEYDNVATEKDQYRAKNGNKVIEKFKCVRAAEKNFTETREKV